MADVLNELIRKTRKHETDTFCIHVLADAFTAFLRSRRFWLLLSGPLTSAPSLTATSGCNATTLLVCALLLCVPT